jgi:hypothetical protein
VRRGGAGIRLQEAWRRWSMVGRRRHVELGGVDVPRARCDVVHEVFGVKLGGAVIRAREEGEVPVAEVVRAEEFLGEAGLLVVEARVPKFVVVVGRELVVVAVIMELLVVVVVVVASIACADVETQAN